MSISQYLRDHANAGACADTYYTNQHDSRTCQVAPGVCSVIAYLVMELKNAEQQVRANAQPPIYTPPNPKSDFVPLLPVPPVSTGGTNGGNYAQPGPGTNAGNLGHSSDLATWNDSVEKR